MNIYRLKLTTILSIFGVIFIISFFYIDSYFFKLDTKELFFEKTKEKILKKEEIFNSFFKEIKNHLSAIENSKIFQKFLENRTNLNEVEELFFTFTKANSTFMQLRFIDKNGQEVIRVDRNYKNDNVFITPQSELQNKKGRYYFQKILNSNSIWYSKIDLNMEYNKIETPHIATMRVGIAIFKNSKKIGILIVNFFMEDFLKTFRESSLYESYLIDKNGNFLCHPNREYSWSFYLKKNYTLKDEFPNIYRDILNKSIFFNDRVFSKKINFNNEDGLIFILKSKRDSFRNYILNHKENILFVLIIIVILSIPIAYIFSLYPTKLHNELKNQKQNYKTMLDSLPIMVFYKDKINNIVNMNKLAYKFLNIENRFNTIAMDAIFPHDKEECYSEDLEVINSQKPKIGIIRNSKLKDKKITLKIAKFPIIQNKESIGLIVIAEDITTALKLKDENQKKEKLLIQQSKMAEIGAMVDIIAHQWKQPLNAISILIDDFKEAREFNELTKEYMDKSLESIIRQVDFMNHTIDDFRYFFKPIEDKKAFSLKNEIEKVINILKPELKIHNIKVDIKKEESLSDDVEGYSNEFKQVILNLITNSKDAIIEQMEKEVIEDGVILISIEKQKSDLMVKILDNGGGISKEIISEIFELHSSTKGEKGSGVGLYISKIIIEEKMGGKLSVKNIEDGSEFSISLKSTLIIT